MAHKNLMKLTYYDYKSEVHLEAYADTVVLEKTGNSSVHVAAIRFGGYPESVKGMAEAIFGGSSVIIDVDDKPTGVSCYVKQYRKEYSYDGIYAEATLMVQDEEQQTDRDEDDDGNTNAYNRPRKCYLFCEQGDSDRLFEELDKKTAVPLIPEFKDYILTELQNRHILKQLLVISQNELFDVWTLNLSEDEKNIISVVNDGLKSGVISIPGTNDTPFPKIFTVTQYLNSFGVMIAERIQKQFNPLFNPATETLSPEILAVNENIRKNAGYHLYDAQLAVAEAHKRCLEHSVYRGVRLRQDKNRRYVAPRIPAKARVFQAS